MPVAAARNPQFAGAAKIGMLPSMDPQRLDEVRACLAIDATAEDLLTRFFEIVRGEIPEIVDEFCECIVRDPGIARRTNGGEFNLHCLKKSLAVWLETALTGPHFGVAFLESRRRIGKVHVQIALPQEMMFTAMNCIRSRLLLLALDRVGEAERRNATVLAVNRILDLELALMIESYREHQQDQIKTHERLATIGQLAASIGHELRNPLGTIETSVYLVAQRLEKLGVQDERAQHHVDKARKQVQLCSKIITDLLELARSRPPQRQLVNVERLVDEAFDALELPGTVIRRMTLAPDLLVLADPEQLRSVLVNLIENGRDAIGNGGAIEVEGFVARHGVAIRIRDSGPGITQHDQARIFEPLFTTKSYGNGLGLALCQRIVSAHGGTIELERVATGASFLVWLPALSAESTDLTPHEPA
jgi:signal transduction histidine kinase